jgi:hypothetical protein
MRARIRWLRKDEGGREYPPSGVGSPPYATIVRFADSEDPWPPPVAWSLVVKRIDALGDPYNWTADVRFLSNEAPHDSLRNGREFALYEGRKRVARGWISDDRPE